MASGRKARTIILGFPNQLHPDASARRRGPNELPEDLAAGIRPRAPPPPDLPFPFDIRRGVGLWKAFFFHRQPAALPPSDTGQYLVEVLAHCAECHSTRNLFGAIKAETRYAGGKDVEGVGFVPNITPQNIGNWSENDLMRLLGHGLMPDGKRVGSTMADVTVNTAMLPEADRQAIARYVKSLLSRPTPAP